MGFFLINNVVSSILMEMLGDVQYNMEIKIYVAHRQKNIYQSKSIEFIADNLIYYFDRNCKIIIAEESICDTFQFRKQLRNGICQSAV